MLYAYTKQNKNRIIPCTKFCQNSAVVYFIYINYLFYQYHLYDFINLEARQTKINQDKMFLCECNPQQINVEQLQIIQSKPEPCRKHNGKQIHFVCKDCSQSPLLCDLCIDDHHKHSWVTLNNYFTPEVVELFTTGRSRNGQEVDACVESLMHLVTQYSNRLIQKIKDIQIKIAHGLDRLKNTFPLQGGYKITSNQLNNREMFKILQIVRNESQSYNCAELQRTFKDILQVSESSICENLEEVAKSLEGHQWEVVNEEDLYQIQKNYLSRFQPVHQTPLFLFSATDKNPGIRLEHAKRVAVYQKQIPKFPVALAEKCLTPQLPKIRFKIMKMEKSMIFFDCSRIFLGVCIPELAQSFSYTNLGRQSKGAYLISSDGRAYHSKLPEYNDIRSHWSFGQGDVIKVGVDFQRCVLYFQKNSSKVSLGSKFQMRLGLDKNYMQKLRPCIMFAKEPGAEVAIYNKKDNYVEGSFSLSDGKSAKENKTSKSVSLASGPKTAYDKSPKKK